MSKKLLLVSLGITMFVGLLSSTSYAEYYYYHQKEKINLTPSTKQIAVKYIDNYSISTTNISLLNGAEILDLLDGFYLYTFKNEASLAIIKQVIEKLRLNSNVIYADMVFNARRETIIITNEFIVKFKENLTVEAIMQINEQLGGKLIKKLNDQDYTTYIIQNKDRYRSTLDIANKYAEHPQVEYASPNFIRLMERW